MNWISHLGHPQIKGETSSKVMLGGAMLTFLEEQHAVMQALIECNVQINQSSSWPILTHPKKVGQLTSSPSELELEKMVRTFATSAMWW